MKRNLLKTLLVAVGLVMGVNAWGQIASLPFSADFEDGETGVFVGGEVTNGTNVKNVLAINNTTSTATFDTDENTEGEQAYALKNNETVTFSYTAYHGWITSGKTTDVSIKNSNGTELFGYSYTHGTCNITDVRIGGNTVSGFAAFSCQGKSGNKSSNGFTSNPYTTNIDDNVTINIKISGLGFIEASFAVPSKSISQKFSGSINETINLAKFSITNNNNNLDRAYGIDNVSITSEISETTSYLATFTEKNGLEPAIKVYTDEAHTNEISAASLSANTTYYFVATLEGYKDYSGSFDVKEENPTVEFTMEAKDKFTYSVNLVDEDNKIIKTLYTNNEIYEGVTINYSYPKYITDENGKVTHAYSGKTYTGSVSPTEEGTTDISYTTYKGTAYFVEAEDLAAFGTKMEDSRLSGGISARGAQDTDVNLFEIKESGMYKLTYVVYSNNTRNDYEASILNNDNTLATETINWSINYAQSTGVKSIKKILALEGDVIKINPTSTNVVLDYAIIERTGDVTETVSVSDAGLATYCPLENSLDFSAATKIAAYKASVNDNIVTLTKVTTVGLTEGVLLRSLTGGAVTEDIAITPSLERNEGNAFVGNIGDTWLKETNGDITNYVLSKENGVMGFYKAAATDNGTFIAKGKAYLPVATASAAKGIKVVYDGETTGISTVKNDTMEDNTIYNLNGQRVAAPAKGLYIMNGKKIIVK